jgi:hypothetical protein
MTSRVVRAYAAAGAVVVFAASLAGVSARGAQTATQPVATASEPALVALEKQRQAVQQKADTLRRLLGRDAGTQDVTATPPVVRVTSTPPVTQTASS